MNLRVSAAAVLVAIGASLPGNAAAQGSAKPLDAPANRRSTTSPRARATMTTLDVTVTDTAGKPLAGALVVAAPMDGAYGPFPGAIGEQTRSALTNSDGQAKLESPPRGPWTVTVYARGFVTQPRKRVAGGPLVFRLEKGSAITGLVRDGEGLRPLAGVRVKVAGSELPAGWQEEVARNEACTDAQGRFRLEGISRSPVRIVATAPGFTRAERANVSGGTNVDLFLFSGASLGGTVKDENGRPVRDASVRAEGDRSWDAPPTEHTDAEGEFQIAGVNPGEYTVVARKDSKAPAIATVTVQPGGEARVALMLSDGGYATGCIVKAGGGPLAGRARLTTLDGHGVAESAGRLLTAEAKADGTFVLGPLPLGTLEIEASAPGHAAQRVRAEMSARTRTVELGEIALETGLSVRGRVHDRQKVAIAGALVAAIADQGGETAADATSSEDGSFSVGGLPAGRYRVSAAIPGYARASVLAEAGGAPVDLVLDLGGTITGRVADESGAPIEAARVEVRGDPRETGRGAFNLAFTVSDEGGGRFALRDVAPGTYTLQASTEGRGEASRSNVSVAAGATQDVGTLILASGGVVLGAVVDAEGRGIPGATVVAERDASRRMGLFQTQSGVSGAFEIRGVPVGPVHVFARHPAYADSPPVEAQVDPSSDPVPVRIVLARGGRVEGRALHRDGTPFAGGRVSSLSLERKGAGMRPETTALDPDGTFTLDHVPPGRTLLTLMAFTPSSGVAPGANMLTSVASREIQVGEGETVSGDLVLRDVVLAGRITRGGQPAPAVRVEVRTRQGGGAVMMWTGPAPAAAMATTAGPSLLAASSREDGSFELLVFSPGSARLQLYGSDQTYPARYVEIPDAERYELDIELPSAAVSGIVVDRASGAPVREAAVSLRRTGGDKAFGASAQCGPDGRFSLSADPGEYALEARAPGYAKASLPLSVGEGGLTDIRAELEPGLAIVGRLLDIADRPAGGLTVVAATPDGEIAHTDSLSDGTFRIGSLHSDSYSVVGGAERVGFGMAKGVEPGGALVVLRLRPPGQIAVRVVDRNGAPVQDAFPIVVAIDGVRVILPGSGSGPTDAAGTSTLPSPAGVVDVTVHSGKSSAQGRVTVTQGETASLEVALPSPAAP